MITASNLAKAWTSLYNTHTINPTKKKAFKQQYDAIATQRKRLSPKKQIEFIQIIHKTLREKSNVGND